MKKNKVHKFFKNLHKFFKNLVVNAATYLILAALIISLIYYAFKEHKVNYFACKDSVGFTQYYGWDDLGFYSNWFLIEERFTNTNFILGIYDDKISIGPGEKPWEKQWITVDRMNGTIKYVWKDKSGHTITETKGPCEKINKSDLPVKRKAKL